MDKIKNLFNIIKEEYGMFVEWLSDFFTPEEYESSFGYSDRFPSAMSIAFRFALKYAFIIVPVILLAMIVLTIVEGLPFLAVFIVPLIATALVLVAIVLAFVLLMLIESFCKIIASLILYGELPEGAENPPDAIMMYIVKR